MPLKGIKVLEFVGLAPAPFCGKILSDFGASVVRIDKIIDNQLDCMHHGKKTLAINLKKREGQNIVLELATKYDVLIEPFRPGVMEKLNLGPELLRKKNSRLIYARLTGFGQTGKLANRAGHDINYSAISGVLSMLGRHNEKPTPPINILADFAGGSLVCTLGICLAIIERSRSGCGQIVDSAMVDGAAYVASWLFLSRSLPIWGSKRGQNVLDSGSFFYDTYLTKDGKYMSVGALEPEFFEIFKQHLNLTEEENSVVSQYESDPETIDIIKIIIKEAFLRKDQDEWTEIFDSVDGCVFPVIEWDAAINSHYNKQREMFVQIENHTAPKPAPRLSRTPGKLRYDKNVNNMEEAVSILQELNLTESNIRSLIKAGILLLPEINCKI